MVIASMNRIESNCTLFALFVPQLLLTETPIRQVVAGVWIIVFFFFLNLMSVG